MNALIARTIVLAMALTLAAVFSPAAEPAWVSYEPAVVTLSGTIVKEAFGEDAAPMDVGRHVWILRLDRPISVRGIPKDEINTQEENVREIHLNAEHRKYPIPEAAFGKTRFVVKGTLYHAITAHHLRPIVMLVSTIEPAAK